MALKRIQREFDDLATNPVEGALFDQANDSPFQWNVVLNGPKNSPYEEGQFDLRVVFPPDYPFKEPKMSFVTRIYHPNVNSKGQYCASDFYKTWTPRLTVRHLILSTLSLLSDPNPYDPLDFNIAKQYKESYELYMETARAWTKEHASKPNS